MNKTNIFKAVFCAVLFLTISLTGSKIFSQDYEGTWCKAECITGPNYGMHTYCLIIKSYDGTYFQMYNGTSDGRELWYGKYAAIGGGVFESMPAEGTQKTGKGSRTLKFITMDKVVYEDQDVNGNTICKVIYRR